MKPYDIKSFDLLFKDVGYTQEGYESILPFNSWLALSKIKLTKDVAELRRFIIPTSFEKQTKKFFDFVDKAKTDGFDELGTTHDDYGNEELCFRKKYSRRLTNEELDAIYLKYANAIVKKNKLAYSSFTSMEKKRLAKELSDNAKREAEYNLYLSLKDRFENGKI